MENEQGRRQHKRSIQFLKCEPEAVTLVKYRLWPSTTKFPKLAFHMELLKWLYGLLMECHILPKIYTFDTYFQLVRKALPGKQWEEPKHCNKFFLDQTLVDGVIGNYYEDRGKPDVKTKINESTVTDNGTAFTCREFAEFIRVNGIKHRTTAPWHPAK
ncbi:Hypothetical predicted protein [Mytilus galloprovincialis]|uniref:Integrase catalytic domain-containing protein n=1 Tax=Mytilus galloprovincialis TaxID=29158 RepID=A0A8B6FDF7_MYTGA|nr:Hypothetical predicted protein [Mytilus galloprovincialis]